ncbi:alkaline phosphatase [Aliidiomarina quisquiliarum]|uniref:alkaline phosphatase n=1 Tax=Aliidiomarina quisquiliarum TaxID=2938947 RepID=UPI00208E050E|nr:alkaline phosphatase [Aliidiomarina quisquiliarum]MCO4321629.1 alkaline phosphatase [Aliidiomarina quisquiliarum]
MRNWFVMLLTVAVLVVSPASQAEETPKNMILIIGDGMGMPYLTAYRYFKDGRAHTAATDVERTVLDRYFVGTASTYPADDTWVTDSAAGATALATGIKSYNGAISVDAEQNHLPTMMEIAKDRGYLTATVATTRLTHATPAGFFTHVRSRRMENEIARQYATPRADGQYVFDLIIGSGSNKFRFTNDDGKQVDYLNDMTRGGVRVVESYEALQTQHRLPVAAFIHENNFPYVIDDKPRLKELVTEALRLIEADGRPYVLMIEASMIDWCGHANDIACAMHEMLELDLALEHLVGYVEGRNDTALVLTADHSTGGLTLGADGQYQWRAAQVNRIQRSLRVLAQELAELPMIDWHDIISENIPFPLSTDQQAELDRVAAITGDEQWKEINTVLIDIVRFHTGTGFTTGGHTAEDVPVIAVGPWAAKFRGQQDHTDIAKQYIEWIKARN